MTNSRYRCTGCKGYFRRPPWRTTSGGQGVCSQECLDGLYGRQNATKAKQAAKQSSEDIPAATRHLVLARDHGQCRHCGKPTRHLHHIRYRSSGVDHSPHNLIVLCPRHHDLIHSDKARWLPVCLAYVWLATVERRSMYLHEVETELRKSVRDSPDAP